MIDLDTVIQEWKRAGLAVKELSPAAYVHSGERDVQFFPTDAAIPGSEVLVYCTDRTSPTGESWYMIDDSPRYQWDDEYTGVRNPSDVALWKFIQRYTKDRV